MERTYSRIKWRRYLYYPALISTIFLLILQIRQFFFASGWRWVYIFFLSTTLSFCLTPLFSRLAQKLDIVDLPDSRKLHKEATPLLGGAAVFIGFLVSILANGIYTLELGFIIMAASVIFLLGVVDDFKEISAGLKLLGQILCTTLVISGGIVLRVIPDTLGSLAVVVNILLTFFWIIGITNALNFFDGMDGLAAGLSAIISFFLGVIAFQTDQPFLGWIAIAMMGSCLGFLPYNFKLKGNASIFLGDAGSTVIGFILACVAVYGDWAENNPVVALASPLLIFWIMIFDMVHISADRIINGKISNFRQCIEYVGKDHLHHRLANALGGNKKSVLFIFGISFCLGTSAIVLRNARTIDAILLLVQASVMVVLITILERRGRTAGFGEE